MTTCARQSLVLAQASIASSASVWCGLGVTVASNTAVSSLALDGHTRSEARSSCRRHVVDALLLRAHDLDCIGADQIGCRDEQPLGDLWSTGLAQERVHVSLCDAGLQPLVFRLDCKHAPVVGLSDQIDALVTPPTVRPVVPQPHLAEDRRPKRIVLQVPLELKRSNSLLSVPSESSSRSSLVGPDLSPSIHANVVRPTDSDGARFGVRLSSGGSLRRSVLPSGCCRGRRFAAATFGRPLRRRPGGG